VVPRLLSLTIVGFRVLQFEPSYLHCVRFRVLPLGDQCNTEHDGPLFIALSTLSNLMPYGLLLKTFLQYILLTGVSEGAEAIALCGGQMDAKRHCQPVALTIF
jgi:hypothetical protein